MAGLNAYRIEVTIPLALPREMREQLVDAVAEAVHAWEPDDRKGWDAFVSGLAIYDDLTEEENAALLADPSLSGHSR